MPQPSDVRVPRLPALPDRPAPGRLTVRSERRQRLRSRIHRPFVAVPVLSDGSPDWERRASGTGFDLSPDGIGLDLDIAADFPAKSVAVLLTDGPGSARCAGIQIRYRRRLSADRLRLGGRFGGLAQEILRPELLLPTFHWDTRDFRVVLPEAVLAKWAALGVLERVLVDRVQLCPECHGLPTFRPGCPRCGSVRVTNGDAPSNTGLHCCEDCHGSDTELEPIGQCLACGFRFPGRQAYLQELRGYYVRRLAPLSLLPPADPVK